MFEQTFQKRNATVEAYAFDTNPDQIDTPETDDVDTDSTFGNGDNEDLDGASENDRLDSELEDLEDEHLTEDENAEG